MCVYDSRNPTNPSDLTSNIADPKLSILKTGYRYFLKDKTFQISCLKNPCDLEVSCKETLKVSFIDHQKL